MKANLTIVIVAMALGLATCANGAPITIGDVIKIDFSTAGDGDGGSLADWNQTTNGATPIAAGSVIRHGDSAVVDSLGISFSGGGGGSNNDAGAGGWAGTTADPYYISAADDIYFGPGALTTTFSGLDSSLEYNVRISSLIGNNATAVETLTVTDGAGTQSSATSRGARWSAATLEAGGSVFNGLNANGSGAIDVTIVNTSGGGGYYPLNAIVLEAVAPPPPIAGGDVIAVDLGDQAGAATNFNLFTGAGSIGAGDVVRLGDGTAIGGVSLTLAGVSGQNNPGVWGGTAADPYLVDAATDGLYRSPGDMVLTIDGLDDEMTYNVRVYPLINGEGGRITDAWINGTQLADDVDRQDAWDASALEDVGLVFNDVNSVGGELEILVNAINAAGGSDWFTWNAVTIEAVAAPIPEPSTIFLAALGLLGIGWFRIRRKR